MNSVKGPHKKQTEKKTGRTTRRVVFTQHLAKNLFKVMKINSDTSLRNGITVELTKHYLAMNKRKRCQDKFNSNQSHLHFHQPFNEALHEIESKVSAVLVS